MTKIATIEKVVCILPHPNAKNLDLVYLTNFLFGITAKGEYKVKDTVVYIRPGTKLPLLKYTANCYRYTRHGFVQPINLQGIRSPGLIVDSDRLGYEKVGEEVSYLMGITLYRGKDGINSHAVESFGSDFYEYKIDKNFPFNEVANLEEEYGKLLTGHYTLRNNFKLYVDNRDKYNYCELVCVALYFFMMLLFWAYYQIYTHYD